MNFKGPLQPRLFCDSVRDLPGNLFVLYLPWLPLCLFCLVPACHLPLDAGCGGGGLQCHHP